MKILGQPQVRPDMVISLLRLLDASGGAIEEDEAFAWMAPSVASDGSSLTAKRVKELVSQVAEVARALGFIKERCWELACPAPSDHDEFGYALHDALLAAREWDIVDTYASLIVEIELKGVDWMSQLSQEDLANRLGERVSVPASDDPHASLESAVMNSSRWAAWRSWATTAGLGFQAPAEVGGFFPNPARLVERVARNHPVLRAGRELEAPDFLQAIATELPYLDGGKRAAVAWQRSRDAPRVGVSFVLSTSLRELHDRKVIELRFEGGDRAGARRLYDDESEIEAFATIGLGKGAT